MILAIAFLLAVGVALIVIASTHPTWGRLARWGGVIAGAVQVGLMVVTTGIWLR